MKREKSALRLWLPVALWSAIIALESTFGAAANTAPLLREVVVWVFGQLDSAHFEVIHYLLRKGGHFLGYGIYGFLWFRALLATLPKGGRLVRAGLAIACIFLIASLDEWHQSFSPSRTGQFGDVLLDTFGAFLFVSMAMVAVARRRNVSPSRAAMGRLGRAFDGPMPPCKSPPSEA